MAKIICKEPLKAYSQSLILPQPVRVQDLPRLLKIPEEMAEAVIAVRDHQKLELDAIVYNDDEIIIFLAVMGG